MNRQKELDADSKATQQVEFVGQLKNPGDVIVDNEFMFVLTLLEKIKEARLKFSQEDVTFLQKMANHQEAKVKLINTQLNKIQSAAKNKTVTTLPITKKNFQDDELSHEFSLTKSNKDKNKKCLR